jgi:hypothetical protein
VDFTLGHLKQLLREPRRIEILGQDKIPHFQSEVATIDVARSAAEQASSKGVEYSRHLNPFYHEAKSRFFKIF